MKPKAVIIPLQLTREEEAFYAKKYPTFRAVRKRKTRFAEEFVICLQGSFDLETWIDIEVLEGLEVYQKYLAQPLPEDEPTKYEHLIDTEKVAYQIEKAREALLEAFQHVRSCSLLESNIMDLIGLIDESKYLASGAYSLHLNDKMDFKRLKEADEEGYEAIHEYLCHTSPEDRANREIVKQRITDIADSDWALAVDELIADLEIFG